MVYFTTRFTSNGEPGAVYAIRTTDAPVGVAAVPSVARPLRVSPNPSPGGRLSIEFDVPGRSPSVDLAIYDVAGRRLRTLLQGAVRGSSARVTWDGRDERGMPVAAGSYFARLTGQDGVTGARRVTVLR